MRLRAGPDPREHTCVRPDRLRAQQLREPAATPIQSTRNGTAEGRVEVFPEHVAALDGIADFDFAWLLLWLDLAEPPPADGHVVPFMLAGSDRRFGVFATRHPARPNPIGLSVVRVVEVDGSGITFRGVDACHGTPVLDIKPWEQHLDVPGYADGWAAVSAIRGGWYAATGVAGSGQLLPGCGRGRWPVSAGTARTRPSRGCVTDAARWPEPRPAADRGSPRPS